MSHLAAPVQISKRCLPRLERCGGSLLLLLTIFGCQGPVQKVQFDHAAMGTRFRIVAYHRNDGQVEEAIQHAFEAIDDIEDICSDWKSDSEIRRLCRSGPHSEPVQVSRHLLEVLSRAVEVSRISDGAFDPTVGPLVRLWRRCQRAGRLPSSQELERARETVGVDSISINKIAGTVQLLRSGLEIDLGGIAKGYAVEVARKVMEAEGISSLLIDGGGDISFGKPPPHERSWKLEVQPTGNLQDSGNGMRLRINFTSEGAVATSGDATRFIEIEGKRYSHILDPVTGIGVPGPHAVTVFARDGATADALATAISVLSPDEAAIFIGRFPGSAALLFNSVDGRPLILGDFPGYPR